MKQLKVVIGESVSDTKILIDDEPLGWVQDIRIHVSVDKLEPEIEITFPQYNEWPIKDVEQNVARLADFPNVKIKYNTIG